MSDKFYSLDPRDYIAQFGGIYITGFAEGTYFKVSLDEDDYNETSGAHGDTTRIRNRKNTGEITFTLQESAVTNTLLSTHRLADLSTGRGVLPFILKDVNGETAIAAKASYIKKAPEVSGADTVTSREWVIRLHGVRETFFAGGKTPIV